MLRIWGRNSSINVQKVMWTVEELGLDHERLEAGGVFGFVDTEEYFKLNPNRLVPTIDDDGFVLWESQAIVRYLCAKHSAGNLWPDDLQVRADADRWMEWMESVIVPSLRPVFWQLIRTKTQDRDPDAIEMGVADLAKQFAILDATLAGRDFVAGKAFTMGDIPIGCATYRYFGLNIERPSLPNLEAWYQRLTERPAFRVQVMLPIT